MVIYFPYLFSFIITCSHTRQLFLFDVYPIQNPSCSFFIFHMLCYLIIISLLFHCLGHLWRVVDYLIGVGMGLWVISSHWRLFRLTPCPYLYLLLDQTLLLVCLFDDIPWVAIVWQRLLCRDSLLQMVTHCTNRLLIPIFFQRRLLVGSIFIILEQRFLLIKIIFRKVVLICRIGFRLINVFVNLLRVLCWHNNISSIRR